MIFTFPLNTKFPTNFLSTIYQEYVDNIDLPVLGHSSPPRPPWQVPRVNVDVSLRTEIAKDTPGNDMWLSQWL